MIRGIARSMAAAAFAGIVLFAASAIDFFAFCEQHRAWTRRQSGESLVIRSESMAVARPGDAIFLCTSQHCFDGTANCHIDLGCYCAPAELSPDQVAGFLTDGKCSVDQPFPAPGDVTGSCQHASCDGHIPPLARP
jgi:hypothetical protein